MQKVIVQFMRELDSVPGWPQWRREKIKYTLYFDDLLYDTPSDRESEFIFPKGLEEKHAVVMGYLALVDSVEALRECEYYFRRYPFRGLPISRSRHLVHVCEMYFSRFYEIKERVKKVLNAANECRTSAKIDVSAFLKLFDKTFDQEIRVRNRIHHHDRFDDVATGRIFLIESLALSKKGTEKFFERSRNEECRIFIKEWVERVRRRSTLMDEFVEAVALAIVDECNFRIEGG